MNRKIYWGRVWAQESMAGGWLNAKVRPCWYWWLRRIRLFSVIVWRTWDTARLDWSTAWEVSECAVGLVGPVDVHKGHPEDLRIQEYPDA